MYVVIVVIVVVVVLAALLGLRTVEQASVGVVTRFGKYKRVIYPGISVIIPLVEKVMRRVPVQNQTTQLEFAAITADQASVSFKATIIYTVSNHDEDTIKLVAFKFISPQAFVTAMTSAVEAAVRQYVSTQTQSSVLGQRAEIAQHAKDNLGEQLASWGYNLVELTVNDIVFSPEVMAAMNRVSAATNLRVAATAEGEALLIKRTKEAEAEGAAIRIAAESEATAAQLRGQGIANMRTAIAAGIAASAESLEERNVSQEFLALALWTEALHDTARDSHGNILFFDGSESAFEETLKRLQALLARGLDVGDDPAPPTTPTGRRTPPTTQTNRPVPPTDIR